ncbi:arabinan endo-1,5-alpha-L-arabinosidase [Mucilaginibacter yixingensis]|uniref:Arabinan endo-1,5-alpha-L-arabinosidase n=1 Tax=Mucilaginibacter yixingensis TaxID=1295612 RepID=A0A2T5JBB5_9SPHI|nr:family 43 glycosylhydrolase [Mucilaginibacter yixingensis]PTQ98079.1 arabinan endo-1,5-alpha-L-arabinosidase [Mucilaginibacter yixingensis]
MKEFNRRFLLWLCACTAFVCSAFGQRPNAPVTGQVYSNIGAHDPVMIRQDSLFYLFCTGNGIAMWSSKDLVHWKAEPKVVPAAPTWLTEALPNFKGNSYWAPDISYYNGQYYLFYAASAFGKNTSCIGLLTSPTLHTDATDYKWTDHGKIIQSFPNKTNWNAIDPNLVVDKDGTPYLAFGSFWDGLKLIKLEKDRMSVAEDPSGIPTIASRKNRSSAANPPAVDDNPKDAGGNAIEGPFIYRKGKYFYLFASIDYCCKGPKSTYKMIIGRSKNIKGPYLDSKNIPMNRGGGDILLAGNENWYGVGHNGICNFDGKDYIVFHGYDAADNGRSKLIVEPIDWVNGWPKIAMPPALDKNLN